VQFQKFDGSLDPRLSAGSRSENQIHINRQTRYVSINFVAWRKERSETWIVSNLLID
jgi:hypothetical protein